MTILETFINLIINKPEITISLLAFIVSVILVYSTISNYRFTRLHDLVKWNNQLWVDIDKLKLEGSIENKIIASKVLNFFEYVSYVYIKNKVDRREIINLFKGELIKNYDCFKGDLGNQTYLKKVYIIFKKMK